MKIESVWTQSEGDNVLYALREKFGDKVPRTLVKYAVREYVESLRQEKMKSRATAPSSAGAFASQAKSGPDWGCPKCGRRYYGGGEFCTNCGAKCDRL